jgi:hypothetical protein
VKYLNEYSDTKYANKSEWAAASGMLESKGDYDSLQLDGEKGFIKLYNPGIKEADCIITINTKGFTGCSLFLEDSGVIVLEWGKGVVQKLQLNSKTNLLTDTSSGKICNEYITGGDFFKIPLGESTLNINYFNADNEKEEDNIEINYNYYYF